ncbi:helix-turn-helix transcriptional regulator [Sphaerisporangium sp. NPDC049002]|uniref:helix-turn-helix domain-containing protein n=1 Tax=unclassified Sphaerisporangium TaxID=2630420 RepID=UPI00340DA8B2
MSNSPTVKRRRLSAALRQLRIESGLTAAEAAKQLDWDPSKITRMERDEWKRPAPHDIRGLLDLYGVTDERRREALLTLARESRQRGWWADYQDVFRSSLPDFEAGASMIRTYEAVVIPGLLQTAAYMMAIFRGGQVLNEAVFERHVQARLARQEILKRQDPPTLVAVIDEAALLKMIGGPDVMRDQIQHLVEMAGRPNITVQVLPNSVGAHPALDGPFVILDFPSPDDPSLVHLATLTDSLWLETPEEIRRYTLIYSQAQASALSPDESVRHLSESHRRLHQQ